MKYNQFKKLQVPHCRTQSPGRTTSSICTSQRQSEGASVLRPANGKRDSVNWETENVLLHLLCGAEFDISLCVHERRSTFLWESNAHSSKKGTAHYWQHWKSIESQFTTRTNSLLSEALQMLQMNTFTRKNALCQKFQEKWSSSCYWHLGPQSTWMTPR